MTNCGSGLGHHELRARLAVVGDVHDHWGEEDELALEYLDPDAVVFVDELPLSSTGKPIKRDLRVMYRNYLTDEKNG